MLRRLPLLLLCVASSAIGASVVTARFNNARTGSNTSETRLTRTNITSRFGKLGTWTVDGAIYGQPLYVPNLVINGAARNAVFVASMHGTVYAFDADRPGSVARWSTHVSDPLPDWPTNPLLYGGEIGCLSTPVIDEAASRLYAVCAGPLTGTSATWTLYSLNLLTGAVVNSVNITGQVAGNGTGGDIVIGGNLQFYPYYSLQRASLLLEGGNIYIGFSSQNDKSPYHGWVFSYDAATLTRQAVKCMSPNSYGGGIWHAGGGPASDGSGSIWVMTGNGVYDGLTDFSDSFVKLNATTLAIEDWFTPENVAELDSLDLDIGSGQPILIPGTSLIVGGAKSHQVWSVDRTNLGHLEGSGALPQKWYTNQAGAVTPAHNGIYGGIFLAGALFLPDVDSNIYRFALTGSTFNTTPVTSVATFAFPGANLAGSSNGASEGILWAVTSNAESIISAQLGTLRAFNATTMAQIYSSATLSRDALGHFTKFAAPTVADGKVFVSTLDNLAVYGALPAGMITGDSVLSGKTQAGLPIFLAPTFILWLVGMVRLFRTSKD